MKNRIYVLGYGNSHRQDDALGPALIEKMRSGPIAGVEFICRERLTVDDAFGLCGFKTVIFVDASMTGDGPFRFYPVLPLTETSFSSDIVKPGTVLSLSRRFFSSEADAFIMSIRGFGWSFSERMTEMAEKNLDEACNFLTEKIKSLLN